MLNPEMEEGKTNILKVIDFDYEIIKLAVEFFYNQDIFHSLNINNACELLRFAEKYDIKDLRVSCGFIF